VQEGGNGAVLLVLMDVAQLVRQQAAVLPVVAVAAADEDRMPERQPDHPRA
jgi:hypothetical protein